MGLSFSDDETEKIKETLLVYRFVKELILFNEELDPTSNTFPQVLNELRNAYDHFNRVLAVKLNIDTTKKSGYEHKSLDKALGHIYRATWDNLDWLNINIREIITKELAPFSHDTINTVIPEYYRDIRPKMEAYLREVSSLRNKKDIESMKHNLVEDYTKIVENLKDYSNIIIDRKSSLIEYESKRKDDRIKENLVRLRFTVLGGFIVYILTHFSIF